MQTPLQIPHLMGNLERCLDLLYIRWGIWRGVWICSTPVCHKVLEVMSDESTLAHFGIYVFRGWAHYGVICVQKGDAFGVYAAKGQ